MRWSVLPDVLRGSETSGGTVAGGLTVANRDSRSWEVLIFFGFRNLRCSGCVWRFRNVRWSGRLHGIAASLAQRNISVTGLQGDLGRAARSVFSLQMIIS